jgi:hypothetical protein
MKSSYKLKRFQLNDKIVKRIFDLINFLEKLKLKTFFKFLI